MGTGRPHLKKQVQRRIEWNLPRRLRLLRTQHPDAGLVLARSQKDHRVCEAALLRVPQTSQFGPGAIGGGPDQVIGVHLPYGNVRVVVRPGALISERAPERIVYRAFHLSRHCLVPGVRIALQAVFYQRRPFRAGQNDAFGA